MNKFLVLRGIEHDKHGWRHEAGEVLKRLPKGCPREWVDGVHLTEINAEDGDDGDG